MKPEYQQLIKQARSGKKENQKLVSQLKKKNPKAIDKVFHALHNKAFEWIDCLECANCCKSISPAVKDMDIRKIAKSLRMKPSLLVEKYMFLDDEQDYVMNTSPCPFLMDDNCCSIYDARPLACKEYPHTDRNKMVQILDLTLRNTLICPAVSFVFEEIKKNKKQLLK